MRLEFSPMAWEIRLEGMKIRGGIETIQLIEELRHQKLKCYEKSWRPEETFCYSDSGEISPFNCPVAWGCPLQRSKIPNECHRYDTKQSEGEAPEILKLWRTRSTPSLPSLPGPFWPRDRAPYKVLSMGQIELNCVLKLNGIAISECSKLAQS